MNTKDYLESFKKTLEDLHKLASATICDEMTQTSSQDEIDDPEQIPELSMKVYRVHIDGEHHHVHGDGLFEREDGSIVIYGDVRKGSIKAIFNNWDCVFLADEK